MGRTTEAARSCEAFVAGIRRITLITSGIISLCAYDFSLGIRQTSLKASFFLPSVPLKHRIALAIEIP